MAAELRGWSSFLAIAVMPGETPRGAGLDVHTGSGVCPWSAGPCSQPALVKGIWWAITRRIGPVGRSTVGEGLLRHLTRFKSWRKP